VRPGAVALLAVAALAAGFLLVHLGSGPEPDAPAAADSAEPAGDPAGSPTGPPSVGEETSGGAAGGTPVISRQDAEPAEDAQGGSNDGVAEPGEAPAGEAPPGGVAGEAGSYDPLGTGAKPGDLNPTQELRAEAAAFNFVVAAYAVAETEAEADGTPLDRYDAGVYRATDPEALLQSPAGATIKAYREALAAGRLGETEVSFGRWRVGEQGPQKVVGTATFTVSAKPSAEPPLSPGSYEQRLELRPWSSVYKVSWADEPRRSTDG
jgi:hypothetical protein